MKGMKTVLTIAIIITVALSTVGLASIKNNDIPASIKNNDIPASIKNNDMHNMPASIQQYIKKFDKNNNMPASIQQYIKKFDKIKTTPNETGYKDIIPKTNVTEHDKGNISAPVSSNNVQYLKNYSFDSGEKTNITTNIIVPPHSTNINDILMTLTDGSSGGRSWSEDLRFRIAITYRGHI